MLPTDWWWSAGVASGLLLIPAVAMQMTADVRWGIGDFLVMGCLLMAATLLTRLSLRNLHGAKRALAVGGVALAFILVWVELAVGVLMPLGS